MTYPKDKGASRILISEAAIQARIAEIAAQLDAEYAAEPPLLIGVLNGAVIFMSDLIRAMTIPLQIDFMAVSSYGDATRSSGVVQILKDLSRDIAGRRILVVEDIIDSGMTLQYLLNVLSQRVPSDIRVAALLKKQTPNSINVQADYVGFDIPDEFVVGYGLDVAGTYRNLPHIAVLDDETIQAIRAE